MLRTFSPPLPCLMFFFKCGFVKWLSHFIAALENPGSDPQLARFAGIHK